MAQVPYAQQLTVISQVLRAMELHSQWDGVTLDAAYGLVRPHLALMAPAPQELSNDGTAGGAIGAVVTLKLARANGAAADATRAVEQERERKRARYEQEQAAKAASEDAKNYAKSSGSKVQYLQSQSLLVAISSARGATGDAIDAWGAYTPGELKETLREGKQVPILARHLFKSDARLLQSTCARVNSIKQHQQTYLQHVASLILSRCPGAAAEPEMLTFAQAFVADDYNSLEVATVVQAVLHAGEDLVDPAVASQFLDESGEPRKFVAPASPNAYKMEEPRHYFVPPTESAVTFVTNLLGPAYDFVHPEDEGGFGQYMAVYLQLVTVAVHASRKLAWLRHANEKYRELSAADTWTSACKRPVSLRAKPPGLGDELTRQGLKQVSALTAEVMALHQSLRTEGLRRRQDRNDQRAEERAEAAAQLTPKKRSPPTSQATPAAQPAKAADGDDAAAALKKMLNQKFDRMSKEISGLKRRRRQDERQSPLPPQVTDPPPPRPTPTAKTVHTQGDKAPKGSKLTGKQATPQGGYTLSNLPTSMGRGPPTGAMVWALHKVVGAPDVDLSKYEPPNECLREACYGGCPDKGGRCTRYHGDKQSGDTLVKIFNEAAKYWETPSE